MSTNKDTSQIEDLIAKMMRDAQTLKNTFPELRKGQALFVSANQFHPELMKTVDDSSDCFYDDSKIEAFLQRIRTALTTQN